MDYDINIKEVTMKTDENRLVNAFLELYMVRECSFLPEQRRYLNIAMNNILKEILCNYPTGPLSVIRDINAMRGIEFRFCPDTHPERGIRYPGYEVNPSTYISFESSIYAIGSEPVVGVSIWKKDRYDDILYNPVAGNYYPTNILYTSSREALELEIREIYYSIIDYLDRDDFDAVKFYFFHRFLCGEVCRY
ncbi:MAG TPA: hypothetical protein VHO43_06850 [Ignavibacteriales bacterium]|nr:hypothetical protein [Ignavibacteriales bacterium]